MITENADVTSIKFSSTTSSGELFSARVILAKSVGESLGMKILSYTRDSRSDVFFTRKQPKNKDTLINISSTTHERKSPQRKSFFLLDTLRASF